MRDQEGRDPEDYEQHYGDDTDPRDADGSEELEADIMRADHAFGTDLFGTTYAEARAGEGLDRAIAQEGSDEPSVDQTVALLDDGPPDVEDELVGDAVIAPDEFASPEEAAMSVRDEAPGATDHVDRHPVADDEL